MAVKDNSVMCRILLNLANLAPIEQCTVKIEKQKPNICKLWCSNVLKYNTDMSL